MVFGAFAWLGLAFWTTFSISAILVSYFILKSTGGSWDKLTVNWKLSAKSVFWCYVVVWCFNAAAIFIFWNLPIHHVTIGGVSIIQDTEAGINYGIYNSGLIFYILTWGAYLFWVIYRWSNHFARKGQQDGLTLVLIALVLWVFSTVTIGLLFGICSGSSGSSRSICWLPGILYIPHILMTTYIFLMTVCMSQLFGDDQQFISTKETLIDEDC